jgi:glutamate carboxypeptidase
MSALDWIGRQQGRLNACLIDWAETNSGTWHATGLQTMASKIVAAFADLEAERVQQLQIPERALNSHPLVIWRKRSTADVRLFFFGHLDTVYGPEHAFQKAEFLPDGKLRGPGVSDMKGGLLVLLSGLTAFERFTEAKHFGWTIAINSDEETGSAGSIRHLVESARGHTYGFGFEPALPSGALASARSGSGVFTLRFHGRAAHSGRQPRRGRNALIPLARFILFCEALNQERSTVYLNPAVVTGGTAYNMVPDLATCNINIRTTSREDERWALERLNDFIADIQRTSDYRLEIQGHFTAPPKEESEGIRSLIRLAQRSAQQLGFELLIEPTGGTCDGNRLAAAGLPNLDNLGVRGDCIHSSDEFLIPESIVERARLFYLMLVELNRTFAP